MKRLSAHVIKKVHSTKVLQREREKKKKKKRYAGKLAYISTKDWQKEIETSIATDAAVKAANNNKGTQKVQDRLGLSES